MMNDDDVLYEAMVARDHRFDGKFFTGVKTTGVYCRPICPAKPKRENIEFFQSASTAEQAGYRPCLRCRPECAPLSPAWFGKSAVVERALKTITSDIFLDSKEEQFASRFGMTARHLRRLFVQELGITPKQIAFNNRLNFARTLIIESHLPMIVVAMTVGFSSLRRFNDAFKKRFDRSPSQIKKNKDSVQSSEIKLSLPYRPPLDWESLLAFYRSHQIFGVESISNIAYERVFRVGKSISFLRVTQDALENRLTLHVWTSDLSQLFFISQRVRRMFNLDSDPLLVANSFQTHPFLNQLWNKYPGLRLASGWDPYETAICTILGQLVSVTQAKALIAQVVENYGEKIIHPESGKIVFLFPQASILAEADLDSVRTTQKRKATIREFSRLVATKEIDLNFPVDPTTIRNQLLSIKGIGPWSAEYISFRALGNTDAFPSTDLILKRAVEKHSDIDLEHIRPWRSYAAVYFWKHYAVELSKQRSKK